jgi:hypothetical protein
MKSLERWCAEAGLFVSAPSGGAASLQRVAGAMDRKDQFRFYESFALR